MKYFIAKEILTILGFVVVSIILGVLLSLFKFSFSDGILVAFALFGYPLWIIFRIARWAYRVIWQ